MDNQHRAATPAAFLHRMSLIIMLLISGQLLFLAGVFAIHSSGNEPLQPSLAPVLLLAFTAAAGISAMVGHVVFERLLSHARLKETFEERLLALQNATIIRYATMETGGMMAIIGYLLTGHILFPILLVAVLAVQIMLFPTMERCVLALKMSIDEREIVYNRKEWPQDVHVE